MKDPKRNGNAREETAGLKSAPSAFQEGDIVALKPAALRLVKLADMSCRLIYQLGWPNEFLVRYTFETPEDGPCVGLWPCCHKPPELMAEGEPPDPLGLINRKKGEYRCGGHPNFYFEKVDIVRTPQKGDRTTSIILPFIGEFLGFEYRDDEKNPEFMARAFGKGATVTGYWAKLIKKVAEANNLM